MRPSAHAIGTALCALGGLVLPLSGLQAQDKPEPKVNQLIVYGDDPCPQSADDTITVCARKAEAERYRIPEALRESTSPQNDAWTNRVMAYETVTRSGTMSCSPTGAGGWTGCTGRLIDQAYAEKKADPTIRFSELIAAERAKRLETIDVDATETQKRVEELERQIEARQNGAQSPEEENEAIRRKAQEAAERGEDVPADLPPLPPKR
jgi:hypothetical protein